MRTLLIRDADCIATFDHADPRQARELTRASILVRGHRIEAIGPAESLPQTADEVIDARGHLVTPGLVNTHHHMYQSLTRAVRPVQDAELFSWLRGLYPLWAGLTPEMVQVSTRLAMAELLLSGCTTSSDHLYIYPNGVRLEDSIEAAQDIGMRFTATRGSMSVGQSQGGLPPDRICDLRHVGIREPPPAGQRKHLLRERIDTRKRKRIGIKTRIAVVALVQFRHANAFALEPGALSPYLARWRVLLRLSSKATNPRDLNSLEGSCPCPVPWGRVYGAHLVYQVRGGLNRPSRLTRRRHPSRRFPAIGRR